MGKTNMVARKKYIKIPNWKCKIVLKLSFWEKASLIFLVLCFAVGIFYDVLPIKSPQVPTGDSLVAPGMEHFLGTDDIGIDIFSQLLYGTRVSLTVGVSCAIIAGIGGGFVGALSGYYGGVIDQICLGAIDVIQAIPELPLMIVLGSFLGPHLSNIVIAVTLVSWIMPAKTIRSQVIVIKKEGYVTLAKQYGASFFYIFRIHIFPSIFPLMTVSVIKIMGKAVLAEASLAFLGLSDPLSKSWGMLLSRAIGFSDIFLTPFWTWWILPPLALLVLFSLSLSKLSMAIEKGRL